MKDHVLKDPLEQRIGKFLLLSDINAEGDLQIRVYPIDDTGVSWDFPVETFDVLQSTIKEFDYDANP